MCPTLVPVVWRQTDRHVVLSSAIAQISRSSHFYLSTTLSSFVSLDDLEIRGTVDIMYTNNYTVYRSFGNHGHF